MYKYGIVETSEWIMCEINTSLGRFFELLKNHEPSSDSLNVSESKNCQFWSFQKSQSTGSFHQTIRGSLAGSLTLEVWRSHSYSQDLVLWNFWELTDKCVCMWVDNQWVSISRFESHPTPVKIWLRNFKLCVNPLCLHSSIYCHFHELPAHQPLKP
jgi:hypothetical protein